jgi:hypothetical protein
MQFLHPWKTFYRPQRKAYRMLILCMYWNRNGQVTYHMPWKFGLRKIRFHLNFLPQARVSCIKDCLEYIIITKSTTWSKFITFVIISFNLHWSTFVDILHVTTFHFSRKEKFDDSSSWKQLPLISFWIFLWNLIYGKYMWPKKKIPLNSNSNEKKMLFIFKKIHLCIMTCWQKCLLLV